MGTVAGRITHNYIKRKQLYACIESRVLLPANTRALLRLERTMNSFCH